VHVIATAGHVDHGKSLLVRALTGMEPDRWETERRRGMTIDLGFAWMTLPSGEQVAFVDVPGHERFVSNMLAGVGPVPAVMFVVAADEGWMPQSAEHLAAIDALGVRNGILVVTRADLADPAPALRQAEGEIAKTTLGRGAGPGGMEAVAVSALTGQGIPDLVAALGRLAARLPQPDPRGSVRMWLDRVFAIKGSGTVVTGTLQAGTVSVGDELTATPTMRAVRIRGVQSLGSPATQVSGVARVALNLRGVSTRELGRGMALIQRSRWTVASVIDVRLDPPPSEHGQPPGTIRVPPQLTTHIGAARAVTRVRMLGGRFARLSLDHALRCISVTGCCSAIPVQPRTAPAAGRCSARRCSTSRRHGCAATAPPRLQRGNWHRGRSRRPHRTCCAGIGCCGPAPRRPWACATCRRR